jgi:hypothetical protein
LTREVNSLGNNATFSEAPGFSLPAARVLSSKEVYERGPAILVFYDTVGCGF